MLLRPDRMIRAVAATATVVLGCTAVVACTATSDDGNQTVAAFTGNTESSPLSTPLSTPETMMKTQRPEAPAQLIVTNVRIGAHEGFDRVVFDLEGSGAPGWFMDLTERPLQQASGNTINFTGSTAIDVNIDGTVYPFEMGKSDPNIGTVTGTGNITEVKSVGTFEGRSQFVIGLLQPSAYSVSYLEDPKRVVVDIVKA